MKNEDVVHIEVNSSDGHVDRGSFKVESLTYEDIQIFRSPNGANGVRGLHPLRHDIRNFSTYS